MGVAGEPCFCPDTTFSFVPEDPARNIPLISPFWVGSLFFPFDSDLQRATCPASGVGSSTCGSGHGLQDRASSESRFIRIASSLDPSHLFIISLQSGHHGFRLEIYFVSDGRQGEGARKSGLRIPRTKSRVPRVPEEDPHRNLFADNRSSSPGEDLPMFLDPGQEYESGTARDCRLY